MSLTVDHNLNSIISSTETLTINNTGSILIAKGTSAQRPGTPISGMLRFNTDLNDLEIYRGSWTAMPTSSGGSADDAIAIAIAFS